MAAQDEGKSCPECRKKTLQKCLINESLSGVWICSDVNCAYPFTEKSLDSVTTEVTKEEITKDIEKRMQKAKVSKDVIGLVKKI
ncbi:hypothetical protein TRVA0_015S02410 [Trichomonascus vanleenenianus]|uniref:uncharacterized protein n=1 Tax=Trichomonascus vanleenenianus TaxID=2268995 RepID=UPI003EC95C4C